MKSIKGSAIAHCPNGCEPFEAEFWTLIRADQDLELKEALLGGELNLVSCPHCGEYFYHDKHVIYFDPPAEILAFVAPSSEKQTFAEVRKKMQKDFELLKANLASMNIDYDPVYISGLEDLKLMLDAEEVLSLQSEVIAAQSAQHGFKIAAIKPSSARAKGYPLYIPVKGEEFNAESVSQAVKELFAENPAFTLLETLLKDIKNGKELPKKI